MIMEELDSNLDTDGRLCYPDEESRYYIYTGYDKRIIKIVEYKHWYIPIRDYKFHIFDGKINPIVFLDPHNYSFLNNKIVKKPEYSFSILNECKEQILEILIWETFETYIYNYTRIYAKNLIEVLNDVYIVEEIKKYSIDGSIGLLLENMHSFDENNNSLDDIVEREKLKIEDKKNILMFINTQRHNLKKLISEKKYEEALSYIKKTHDSW